MGTRSIVLRFRSLALALAGVLAASPGCGAVAAAVSPHAGAARTARITPRGVGKITLGDTFSSLHSRGLVGRLTRGCELAGPGLHAASLTAPLHGSVGLTTTRPRTVTGVVVTGGARARGVGIGARLHAIRSAFPAAVVDHSTESMFGITLVKIPRRGGGPIQFAIDVKTRRVTLIGIPAIPFCE